MSPKYPVEKIKNTTALVYQCNLKSFVVDINCFHLYETEFNGITLLKIIIKFKPFLKINNERK